MDLIEDKFNLFMFVFLKKKSMVFLLLQDKITFHRVNTCIMRVQEWVGGGVYVPCLYLI